MASVLSTLQISLGIVGDILVKLSLNIACCSQVTLFSQRIWLQSQFEYGPNIVLALHVEAKLCC